MASVSGTAHSSRSVVDIIPQYPKTKVEVGSVRLRPILSVSNAVQSTCSRFPKLEECAHFHYDNVELPPLQVSVVDGTNEGVRVEVRSGNERWDLHRTFQHFVKLDEQLHKCVFAREFSELPKLDAGSPPTPGDLTRVLSSYTKRLDEALGGVSCGPVLTWLELDNRGRRLVASGHGINTPAVAAAFATSTYTASANDELSFQIGDMISVIDMPPAEESVWWRGKRGFLVGFFPSHCVAVITGKIPTELTIIEPTKPVLRKHGKLIAFFRAFILSRPSRRRLKQSGILKERVFGCDLSEHLLNSARESKFPLVLKCCAEFIETHGIVDGIYRLSGVTSNIQKLRSTFDEDRIPSLLEEPTIRQDIHSVASLLKMYFRELPNPLCTYQLYDEFVNAVQSPPDVRLDTMTKAVRKLPPPHYRTLEYLMGHLSRVSEHCAATGMTARNVAIVWAPNLLRCKSLGVAALQGVGVQALVTEFLIINYKHIFSHAPHSGALGRPKSLAVSSPTKLLSLEEAQAREHMTPTTSLDESGTSKDSKDTPKYHTILELPRKRQPLNWRTFFTPLKSTSNTKTYPKHKSVVKSAEFLQSTGRMGGSSSKSKVSHPVDRAPSTHSRSVSHDSYFDTNLDQQPSTSSLHENSHPAGLSLSLDLSELQMNFEMDESEMKIFSEDETNQLFSSGGSITLSPLESNLEQRFSTQELRYIDSYSPDPMDTDTLVEDPVALGYRPLLTPTSSDNIKPENSNSNGASSRKSDNSDRKSGEQFPYEKMIESTESSRKSISPFQYEKMTESGENSRKSDGTHSVESSQKSPSPLGYEKLESSSPDQNHYETLVEAKTQPSTDTLLYKPSGEVIKENNLYESMEHQPSRQDSIYQNEAVVNKLKRDAADNIYEEIQLSSTQEIYEQLSYLRSSVEEVNRLVGGKLLGRIHQSDIGGPPPNKELKKSLSLERIANQEGLKFSEKRYSTPYLPDIKMDSKSKSGSRGNLSLSREPLLHHYETVNSANKANFKTSNEFPKIRRESLEKAYDAFCDADYENVSFSLPLEIKPSSTNVSRIKTTSPVKTENKKSNETKESQNSVKKSKVEKTESNSVPESNVKSDKKLTCSVVSELLKSDVKTSVEVKPIKTAAPSGNAPKIVTLSKSPDEFAKEVDELTRGPTDGNKTNEKEKVVKRTDTDSVKSDKDEPPKETPDVVKQPESNKSSPVTEDVRLVQDLEVRGKTEKLRKFFEKDNVVLKSDITRAPSQPKINSETDDSHVTEAKSPTRSLHQESPAKKDFVRTGSLSKFEFISNKDKESPISPIRQLSRSPSHSRSEFSSGKFNENRPSFEFFHMKEAEGKGKEKEPKSPVRSPIHKYEFVKKEPTSPVKDESKSLTEKMDFFKNKETETKNVNSNKSDVKVKEVERKSPNRPKLEPLPLKDISPTHKLVSPDSPSNVDKKLAGESEADRRERIEKYKEERRSFFRNKYKMDNVNNNSDEDLIRRIKEKTGRTDGAERRKSYEKTGPVVLSGDAKKSPSKTTVSILYSPTRCQAPSWPPNPPANQNTTSTSPSSYPNSPEK